jgi:hypothetical protein
MGPLHISFADSNQHAPSLLDFAQSCQLCRAPDSQRRWFGSLHFLTKINRSN